MGLSTNKIKVFYNLLGICLHVMLANDDRQQLNRQHAI
jgi:hypothetical protein